jgi:hypothetical protein
LAQPLPAANVTTSFVSNQLELLADLAGPTSTANNEYELFIGGLSIGGAAAFSVSGPISQVPLPAASWLFCAAILGLGAVGFIHRHKDADAQSDDDLEGPPTSSLRRNRPPVN